MNTMSKDGRVRAAAAAVTGARHLRTGHNGQDAAVVWAGESSGAVVVCDGCSSGASSEVGSRLGASLFARALGVRLDAGANVTACETWDAVRTEVGGILADLLERLPGDRVAAMHEQFLFTIVAAATDGRDAAVWALGDGVCAFDREARQLGPFENNQPPYLAYDLLGVAHPAYFEVAAAGCSAIAIATDGALDLDDDLAAFATDRFVDHPDALRRQLTVLARGAERIDWDERRVIRTPATLQDDCAIGVVRWGGWS